MRTVRGITAILAGLVLLTLSGTPSSTAEASLRQASVEVLYDGEAKAHPDFNVTDWYPGTEGTETVDIVNNGSDTKAIINAGTISENSIAYDTDVTLTLMSGDVLYAGKYSDMSAEVFVPQDKTLTLNLAVKWNPSPDLPQDITLEALGLHVATV